MTKFLHFLEEEMNCQTGCKMGKYGILGRLIREWG